MRTVIPLTLLATALACSLATVPANARARVFVASYGSDSNPCTFGSPCRNFQQAINTVDAGGEVTAIDSAGYGPVTIVGAVTITSPPGVEAGIVPTSGNPAILIKTSGGPTSVQLRGLTLDGTAGGTDGIDYVGSGTDVEIIDCLIHNFSGDGINISVNPGVFFPGPVQTVIISNTVVSHNGGFGIALDPHQSFSLTGAIDHVITSNNASTGIMIDGTATAGFVNFAISSIVSNSNSGDGIDALGGGNVKVELRDSTISNNTFNGITVSDAILGLYANTIVLNNNSGFAIVNSGLINSWGNNVITDNHAPSTGTLTKVNGQ